MKSLFVAALALGSFVTVGRAGPTERAILAAMKLSEQSNYSWTSTVTDDVRTYDLEGKTDRSGYTWMRLPMVKSIAQRLGRDAGWDLEAIFRGNTRYVIRTGHGWKTLKELPKPGWDWNDDIDVWAPPVRTRGNLSAAALAGLDPLDPGAFVIPPPPPPNDDERRGYSNAQLAVSHPHDELAVIISSFSDLKVVGDVASGTLSDLGAQLLLVRDGQDQITPLVAAGAFKFLITNGIVTRYELRLEGILLIERKKIHVRQDSSTVVKAIGATTVEIAEEARRKLGQ